MDIVVWLRSLGLGKYEAVFRENEIDETVLPNLTAEDLKELGVAALGHRRPRGSKSSRCYGRDAGRPRQELRRRNQHDLAAVGSSAFCGDAVVAFGWLISDARG
jgi:SAM domain (Sterile alpha motif)